MLVPDVTRTSRFSAMEMCFAALATALGSMAVAGGPLAHVGVFAFVALYQLHFPRDSPRLASGAAEGAVFVMVAAIVLLEHGLVMALASPHVPETVRDFCRSEGVRANYAGAAGAALLLAALVPLPAVAFAEMGAARQAGVVGAWAVLAVAEGAKQRVSRRAADLTLAPAACKCAPLLYLHWEYWALAAALVGGDAMLAAGRAARVREQTGH